MTLTMMQGPIERRWVSQRQPAFAILFDFFTNKRLPFYSPLEPPVDDLEVWAERELLSKRACLACEHVHRGRCWHLVKDPAQNVQRLCRCADYL